MKIDSRIIVAEQELKEQYSHIEEVALENQYKVMRAFQENNIALRHFVGSTGYGHDDIGRDKLAQVFSDVFDAEASIVSPYIAGASHALKIALYGLLRPSDILLSISGKPYETLDEVIFGENIGSLKDFGVKYEQIDLIGNNFDKNKIAVALQSNPKIVYIQRSRGYSKRDSLSIDAIEDIIKFVRKYTKDAYIFVDNCYCEFVETREPTTVGADVIVGSLMKNPGGGIVPNGAYISGTQKAIDLIAGAFISPALGLEVGSYEPGYRLFFQGLFLAPHTTEQALKSSMLFGKVLGDMGYETLPEPSKQLNDITRSITLGSAENMIAFCTAIQRACPVDGFATPEPSEMAGYSDDVIMAAGSFVQGASIELSCDGPMREPYIVYMQGGLTYEHCKLALNDCLKELDKLTNK